MPNDTQPANAGQQPPVKDAQIVDESVPARPQSAPQGQPPSKELAVVGSASDALALRRDPAESLAEAKKAATAISAVLAAKPEKVVMNGKVYCENEDWQCMGHFYGITGKLESDKYVQLTVNNKDIYGYEATYIGITRDGRIVARETSMCMTDEERWGARPRYEDSVQMKDGRWVTEAEAQTVPKGEWKWEAKPEWKSERNKNGTRPVKRRVLAGEDPVPIFQIRSMAHTRAESRMFASILRFVAVLGGFGSTPAEELPNAKRRNAQGQESPSQGWSRNDPPPPDDSEDDRFGPAQGSPATSAPPQQQQQPPAPAAPATPPAEGKKETAKEKKARERNEADAAKPEKGKVFNGGFGAPKPPVDAAAPSHDVWIVAKIGDVEKGQSKDNPPRPFTRWPVHFSTSAGEQIAYLWHDEVFAKSVANMIGKSVKVVTTKRANGRLDIDELALVGEREPGSDD